MLNQCAVPPRAILVEKENGRAGRIDPGFEAGSLDFHQGNQAVYFGVLRRQLGQHAAQSHGVLAERRADPVVTSRG